MMRRFGSIGVVVVLAAGLCACGGDDDDAASDDATEAESTDAGEDTVADADDAEADTTEPPEETIVDGTAAPADDESDDGDEPASGGPGCAVEVTGDKTASWTAPSDMSSVLAWYWASESEREFLDNEFSMILNCEGDGGYVGFLSTDGANEETVPYGPGTYEIPDFDADPDVREQAQFSVLVSITDSETNWGLTEPGTLEITAWDDSHIAGTFELHMEDSLASLSGDESEGTIVITGSFDYANV
jgi:hypothetical protein